MTAYSEEVRDRAFELASNGDTDVQIADGLDISMATFAKWMAKYPEFMDAVETGREVARIEEDRNALRYRGGGTLDTGVAGSALYFKDGPQSRKVIVNGGNDAVWLASPYEFGAGYLLQEVVRNDFITTNSLGSPAEPFRRSRAYDVVEALVCNNVETATNGTWTAASLSNSAGTTRHGYDSATGQIRAIVATQATTSGAYKEYLTYVDANGDFTFLYQDRNGLSPAGSTAAVITDGVSGEVISAAFNMNAGPSGVRQAVLRHPTKRSTSFTCRILRGANGQCEIIGVNSVLMTKPNDPTPPASVVYSFSTWLRTDNYFANTHGANDYAYAFFAPGLTGGSVHGGETVVSASALADGAAFNLSNNQGVCTRFSYAYQSLVDARAAVGAGSGDYLDIYASFDLSIDARPRWQTRIVAHSIASTFYTGMVAADIRFKQVNKPRFIADGSAGTGDGDTVDDYLLGKAPLIEWQAANGDKIQRFSTAYQLPGFEQSVLHWDPLQYLKNWDFNVKAANRDPGDCSWYGATSFRRAA